MLGTAFKLLSAEIIRTGVRVKYNLLDDAGSAQVSTVIPEEKLVNFIEDKGLNLETDFAYDYEKMDAYTYLKKFSERVVTEYLQFNLAA